MRKFMARRAAVRAATVAFASTVLLVPLLSTATADPASPDQLAAEKLPAELIAAIARDLKMTPAEYLDRAAQAQQLRNYATTFRSQRPDDFAGAWLATDGKPVMAVTSLDAAKIAADATTRPGWP